MKKVFCLMLALTLMLSLAACKQPQPSPGKANSMMEGILPKPVDVTTSLEAGPEAATDFGVRLFKENMKDGENTLISPLSVLYALAMTANGADGETLAQMEAVLRTDSEELNNFLYAYAKQLPADEAYKLHIANSIWFKDDEKLTVNDAFLQTNADYYGAQLYKAPFDQTTLDDINKWVETETDGMIPEILDKIPENVVMYLVNALAFEAQWERPYGEYQLQNGFFTREDGETQEVRMMLSNEYLYLEDELATGFIKYYEDRKYAFVALLPNEGVTVSQYVDSLSGAHLQEMLKNPEQIEVHASMPKFEVEYDVEMGEALQTMGMPDAFHWETADFSRLGTYQVDGFNIFIGRVLHKTYISVAEQGTKAGAVTIIEAPAMGMMPEIPEYKEVDLDRPFVYMLIDCKTNMPFFIGTMMDVNAG